MKGLRGELDRIDARDPEVSFAPEHERSVRYRARHYRWSPATATRPEGLVAAGGLDGDALQAMVYLHRRVPRRMG